MTFHLGHHSQHRGQHLCLWCCRQRQAFSHPPTTLEFPRKKVVQDYTDRNHKSQYVSENHIASFQILTPFRGELVQEATNQLTYHLNKHIGTGTSFPAYGKYVSLRVKANP